MLNNTVVQKTSEYRHLELETTIFVVWLFQLDDSGWFHEKMDGCFTKDPLWNGWIWSSRQDSTELWHSRIVNAEVFQVPMGWRKASMFFGQFGQFFLAFVVVICCDIRAWFKCCCSQGCSWSWQPGMEARHDWLSLDPQKGVWFANRERQTTVGPWPVSTPELVSGVANQLASGESRSGLRLRWSCTKRLRSPWDWQIPKCWYF